MRNKPETGASRSPGTAPPGPMMAGQKGSTMEKEYFVVLKIANDEGNPLGTFWFGIKGSIGEFPFKNYEKAKHYAEWKLAQERKISTGRITELKIVEREVTPWVDKEYLVKE